jgi:hypothetical protein
MCPDVKCLFDPVTSTHIEKRQTKNKTQKKKRRKPSELQRNKKVRARREVGNTPQGKAREIAGNFQILFPWSFFYFILQHERLLLPLRCDDADMGGRGLSSLF